MKPFYANYERCAMIKLDKSQITKNLGKKYRFVPYLEKAIADFDDEWQFTYHEKKPDHHWHPSSHCVQPATELYAIACGEVEREPISGSLRKTFQVGHFWHQWLQYITLHKLGMCKPEAIECTGKKEWGKGKFQAVAGAGDIAPLEAPGWTGLVDFKTMSAANYARPQLPEFFADKYECQLNIYMYLFDLAEAMILPINKDTGEFREVLYQRNLSLINTIIEKWKFVSACLDAEEAPTKADNDMFDIDSLLTGPIAS